MIYNNEIIESEPSYSSEPINGNIFSLRHKTKWPIVFLRIKTHTKVFEYRKLIDKKTILPYGSLAHKNGKTTLHAYVTDQTGLNGLGISWSEWIDVCKAAEHKEKFEIVGELQYQEINRMVGSVTTFLGREPSGRKELELFGNLPVFNQEIVKQGASLYVVRKPHVQKMSNKKYVTNTQVKFPDRKTVTIRRDIDSTSTKTIIALSYMVAQRNTEITDYKLREVISAGFICLLSTLSVLMIYNSIV